jgi:tetratricopeptide (TPR) repeat protein
VNRANWWWALLLVLTAGCATIRGVRAPSSQVPDTYEAQWQSALSLAAVAEKTTNAVERAALARRAIVLARRARELNPAGVEGHYYYAVNVGWLADANRSYGLDAVGEMAAALKRAGELDEKFDYAGPVRLLAILHLRTPPPPTSIGSPRKALRLLQQAVKLFPDYPENYLYLAEAWRDTDGRDEARAALEKVLAAPACPDWQAELTGWQAQARQLLDKWRAE